MIAPVSSVTEALELLDVDMGLDWIGLDTAALDVNGRGQMIFPVASRLLAKNVAVVFKTSYQAADISLSLSKSTRVKKPFVAHSVVVTIRDAITAELV